MSFILKALKKLEEEKAARQVRTPDISSGILMPDTPSTAPSRRFLMPALVMALAAAGAGMSFFLLTGDKSVGTPAGKSLSQPAPRENQAAQVPTPAPSPMTTPVVEKKTAHGNKAPEEPATGSSTPARTDTASRTTSPAPVPSGSAPQGIKVNGIALQDDPYQSVAVVNGILARKGMIIQGMRIEEIFSDGVKFSGNGETFHVKISK